MSERLGNTLRELLDVELRAHARYASACDEFERGFTENVDDEQFARASENLSAAGVALGECIAAVLAHIEFERRAT